MASIGSPLVTEPDDDGLSGYLPGLNPRASMIGRRIDPSGVVAYPLRNEPKGKGVPPEPESDRRILLDNFTRHKGMKNAGGMKGESDRSLAPFNIRAFRNNQLTGRRALPNPTLTGEGDLMATGIGGPGMFSVQRNVLTPSGKNRRLTTLGATNFMPLLNPRVQVNRKKQVASWPAEKNEHLWMAGDYDHDSLQALIDPEADLDLLGMEDISLQRGPKGHAVVMDERTGLPLPHLSYTVYDLLDPTISGKTRWKKENRDYRDVDAGQDWRETVVGPSKIGGKVTGSIDPILRIPQRSGAGVGVPRYTDETNYRFHGIPVPPNFAAHEGELGIRRGIATPGKGLFFRPEDLTDAGRDVFETAKRGDVIRLSGDSFEDAWDLAKARFPGRRKEWGNPGEMFFWDEKLGGILTDLPTGSRKPVKYEHGGGGNRDIFDFIEANPDKLEQLIGPRKDRFTPDYPLEGMEIPRFSGTEEEAQQLAGFGNPSKMPGISMLDMPMHTCHITGSGACEACYAAQNKMAFNPTQRKYYRNKLASLEDLPGYMSAIQDRMYDSAMKTAKFGRRVAPDIRNKGFIRHKASGDFGSPEEFSAVFDLLQQQSPEELRDLRHWISTRQYPYLMEAMEARGGPQEDFLPENVNIRVSLPPGNEMPSKFSDLELNPAVSTSGFIPKEFEVPSDMNDICPATIGGNQKYCDKVIDPDTGLMGCRRCFRRKSPVNYLEHGSRLKDLLESAYARMSQNE